MCIVVWYHMCCCNHHDMRTHALQQWYDASGLIQPNATSATAAGISVTGAHFSGSNTPRSSFSRLHSRHVSLSSSPAPSTWEMLHGRTSLGEPTTPRHVRHGSSTAAVPRIIASAVLSQKYTRHRESISDVNLLYLPEAIYIPPPVPTDQQ